MNLKISHEEIQKRKTEESLNHGSFIQQTEGKKFNDNINVLTHDNWHLNNRLQRDTTALNDQIRLKDDINNQIKFKDEELNIFIKSQSDELNDKKLRINMLTNEIMELKKRLDSVIINNYKVEEKIDNLHKKFNNDQDEYYNQLNLLKKDKDQLLSRNEDLNKQVYNLTTQISSINHEEKINESAFIEICHKLQFTLQDLNNKLLELEKRNE